MKKLLLLSLLLTPLSSAWSNDDPAADPAATVTVGKARFSVLTDRMIRMEYAPDGVFEDRATMTFVNRRLPVPAFSVKRAGDGCTIDTGRVKLVYKGGEFAPETLSAEGDGFAWKYGDEDKGNLYGTKRTLDAVKDRESLMVGNGDSDWGRGGMGKGLVSRDGWTLVDDSENNVFVPAEGAWGEWAGVRTECPGRRDLYLFAYGHDYRGCLADYIRVAGRIPLPPKWAFGYWWSRWWLYTDREVKDLVNLQRQFGVPMDVFILDMEWHETWNIGFAGDDEYGQMWGWTGYTWNKRLFPDPKRFIDWLHAHGVRTAANLHPASGIQPVEACYPDFCRDYGWTATNGVPYRMGEEKWADCYFKDVIGPLETSGMDFWWIDWQQWDTSRVVKGLNNTFWLNHVFTRHAELRARDGAKTRPMIYHRWGGLGSHRYQVGFSGDTWIGWETLATLPWFTATAANVGYGYWGHDIGGFMDPENGIAQDSELFLRWFQSAVFTPIFKTHCAKSPDLERRIWKYPDRVNELHDAIRLRYRLAPYIYTAARAAYDTGVSLCRPLYYDSPESEDAYDVTLAELMFGDSILAATVVKPADKTTQLADCDVWLPKGTWFDVETGSLLNGEGRVALKRTAAEIPWFVRAGTVVPMHLDDVMSLQQADDSRLALLVTPGADRGEGELYEDGATDADYAEKFARTRFSYALEGTRLRLTIGARKGAYDGMPATRTWELRFPNRLPPASVKVNGAEIAWEYLGDEVTLVATTPAVDPDAECVVEVEWTSLEDEPRLAGKKGFLRRCSTVGEILKPAYRILHWAANVPNSYLDFAQLGSVITADPAEIRAALDAFDASFESYRGDFKEVEAKIDAGTAALVRAQLGL